MASPLCITIWGLSVQALTLPNATVQFSTAVKDLGVVLNSQLTTANHVAALSRSFFSTSQ